MTLIFQLKQIINASYFENIVINDLPFHFIDMDAFIKAREIHRKINMQWLVQNKFIRFTQKPITTQYL